MDYVRSESLECQVNAEWCGRKRLRREYFKEERIREEEDCMSGGTHP